MRRYTFAIAAVLLAVWCVLGAASVVDTLATECVEASSEVGAPCAVGKATYVGFGFLAWCLVALPLAYFCAAARS